MKASRIIYTALFTLLVCIQAGAQDYTFKFVHIRSLGKSYEPRPGILKEYHDQYDKSGSTSVRNNDSLDLKWKTSGYFQRNRDIGQVFIPKEDFLLDALVLRTGPSDKAVLEGMPGTKVFIQFFEVSGAPVINDNGTPPGTQSLHGFSGNHRTDDFIDGISYRSLGTIYRGIFPEDVPVTYRDGRPAGEEGKLFYLHCSFPEALLFQKGKRYAFMVGILEPGRERGFTLANDNDASDPAPPTLALNPYREGR